ncbi:dual specificity protein phosphatase family protein [Nocardiopsis sp. B62]|uniref:dual specificity protein phosphatase family protein n=1 Tax=Nocardiopsis sp. B62 TaxID=2824874 RepID=UPI001B367127|nr:dual specificity protein phosphatase family protein [Nocardiopsis sp. B62]MBQ1079789.1 dual specificity protein phosphatase family protein [Nocardiopsis sp. B62]
MSPAPIHTRPVEEPSHDRAVGSLLGAVAAAALVGTPTHLAQSFATAATTPAPQGTTEATGAQPLAHLVRSALHHGSAPASAAPEYAAWSRALRSLVLTGAAPTSEPVLEHTTNDDLLGVSWRALTRTPHPVEGPTRGAFPCVHLVDTVWAAYHSHGDLAAMYTGALAGARWGASALPLQAVRRLSEHTDPHALTVAALVALNGSHPDRWPQLPIRVRPEQRLPPFAVPHPLDPQVLLGNLDFLRSRPEDVDAAVSLCRTHPEDAPHLAGPDWVRVWLHDTPGRNPNLHFTLDEAASAVAALRAEGKRVLLHCWAGASRTPAVAARYAAATLGAPPLEAMAALIPAVGGHLDNPTLSQAVAELSGLDLPNPLTSLFPAGLPPRRPELRTSHISG